MRGSAACGGSPKPRCCRRASLRCGASWSTDALWALFLAAIPDIEPPTGAKGMNRDRRCRYFVESDRGVLLLRRHDLVERYPGDPCAGVEGAALLLVDDAAPHPSTHNAFDRKRQFAELIMSPAGKRPRVRWRRMDVGLRWRVKSSDAAAHCNAACTCVAVILRWPRSGPRRATRRARAANTPGNVVLGRRSRLALRASTSG